MMSKKEKITAKLRFKRKIYTDVTRFFPTVTGGLNEAQVKQRIAEKKVNSDFNPQTKSILTILKDSTFSLFNFINIVLIAALAYVGSSPRNMLFIGVVLSNILINLVQELRAKKATDKLSLLSVATVTVRRNEKLVSIHSEEVVLDDVLHYTPGSQIVTDCLILEGECEVNESFLTGESEPVFKESGDMLYAGSFLSSGSCTAQADAVGMDNASYEITAGAKKVKTRSSEIVKSLRKIIRIISVVLIPLGTLFYIINYIDPKNSLGQATEQTVSAVIGMIPSGLILLTSTVLAVIVVKLAKRKVLINELYSIEMIARADTICLDKTGTLTEGSMKVEEIFFVNPEDRNKAENILVSFFTSLETNETMAAIGRYLNDVDFIKADKTIPFSSKKKWCGAYFKEKGAYILGAPEIVLVKKETELLEKTNELAEKYRVLCLSEVAALPVAEDNKEIFLPQERKAVCLILLSDIIRPSATETIAYFKSQGVAVKIISGDNPITVSMIARTVGVQGWDNAFDMSSLSSDAEIEEIAAKYIVFGRTTPVQKQLLIKALRKKGHTVAMTGDGVNDVLAMKESDCSITVAEGTDAARTVADIVLLDSSFDAIPKIVDEGRMAINNIQRTASLFLVKTIYSTLLTLIFIFTSFHYPFKPIHLTLIGALTIGIPSFFLAFEPNKERIKGNFLQNIVLKAFPTGVTIVLGIIAANIAALQMQLTRHEASAICVILTGTIALLGVLFISQPLSKLRKTLVVVLTSIFTFSVILENEFFMIERLSAKTNIALLIIAITSGFIFWGLKVLLKNLIKKFQRERN